MQLPENDYRLPESGKVGRILALLLGGAIILLALGCFFFNSRISTSRETDNDAGAFAIRADNISKTAAAMIVKLEVAETAGGVCYYVSPDGSNGNPGTLQQPWKTLDFAGKKIKAGDTLFIRGGIYQEQFYIHNSGTETSPIVVSGYNDEEVLIDGINQTLPAHDSGASLVRILGDWVIVRNLTIVNSGEVGVVVDGSHSLLDGLFVHHNWGSGVILQGNFSAAQNMKIWSNAMYNEGGRAESWGFGISCARYPDYCTIRKTVAWENWGEGISTFEALHTVIENNISYNNQQNFYISDTKYAVVKNNLAYCTPGNPIDAYETQNGILVGDEKGVPIPLGLDGARYPSSDNIFINNLVAGCNRNLAVGTGQSNNNLYAFNTFVNSAGSTTEEFNVLFFAGRASGARFQNNIVEQDDRRRIATFKGSGITFSNNLWSKAPPSVAVGPGDIVGDPLLVKTGTPFTPEWFKLSDFSPAIDKAIPIQGILADYFSKPRDANPDMGAIEYYVDAHR